MRTVLYFFRVFVLAIEPDCLYALVLSFHRRIENSEKPQ